MKLHSLILLASALATAALAQTNLPMDNFTFVTNLWYNGYKTNVLQIAERRLAANSNDLAGLILKMEYDLAFTHIATFSNDIFNVLSAASLVTNHQFSQQLPIVHDELQDFLLFLEHYYRPTPEQISKDRAKALIIHKRMTYEDYLKWLRDDGLF